jgi:hypothetical protein
MTFLRLFWPDAMVTEERGTFKRFAKNSMQAWLARPSTGGVVRETLSASPSSPMTAFFRALGCTLIAKDIPLDASRIGITCFSKTDAAGDIDPKAEIDVLCS